MSETQDLTEPPEHRWALRDGVFHWWPGGMFNLSACGLISRFSERLEHCRTVLNEGDLPAVETWLNEHARDCGVFDLPAREDCCDLCEAAWWLQPDQQVLRKRLGVRDLPELRSLVEKNLQVVFDGTAAEEDAREAAALIVQAMTIQ